MKNSSIQTLVLNPQKTIHNIVESISNILYPDVCIICNYPGNKICDKCKSRIVKNTHHICHVCKRNCSELVHDSCKAVTNLDGVFIAVTYSESVRKIVEDLKYSYHFSTAKLVANLISEALDLNILLRDSIVIPVPLHKSKERFRGFNQAQLIAKEIVSFGSNSQLFDNLLKRNRNTKTQVGMNRDERIENLRNAFLIDERVSIKFQKEIMKYNKVFLIDDIYTTGTTMEECAIAIRRSGIIKENLDKHYQIYGIALARG